MMSIYIKGMEMPKDGSWVTLRFFPDEQCFLYSWCGNDFDFMELDLTAVPVPPHGRLIDADVMKTRVNCDNDSLKRTYIDWIDAQETVIPKEEDE